MIEQEPFKIKSVRNIYFSSLVERKRFLREAYFNTSLIPSSRIIFDMVTQGSSAMSQEQMAALFLGDEAYAGARNFHHLCQAVQEVFDLEFVCPTHNRLGGLKLLSSIYVNKNTKIGGNTLLPRQVVEYFGGIYHLFPIKSNKNSTYRIDLDAARRFLEQNKGKVPFIYIDLQTDGILPISFSCLKKLKDLCDSFRTLLVFDASCITEFSLYLSRHDKSHQNTPIREIIKKITSLASTILFDAGQDAMSNVGGFLATNNPEEHEKHINEVVVFEGLHTYGGMAGRTMEVVSVGLKEMVEEPLVHWIDHQVSSFCSYLEKREVPYKRSLNGVCLQVKEFLSNTEHNEHDLAHTLAAAIFLSSGVRTHLEGPYCKESLLPVLIPRRALMISQVEQIAEAIVKIYQQRKIIQPLIALNNPEYHYEARFGWLVPDLEEHIFTCEPYTIHAVEHVGSRSREDRRHCMLEAGYNTFLLKSEDVTIDLLTDSGTNAMSVDQWVDYLEACETPATPDAFIEIVETCRKIYGYEHVILTHQGRAAEHIMSQMFIKPGDYVPGNMYFTTTKLHQELAGGVFVDVIVDEAHNTTSKFPWKGNIDLKKLDSLYHKAEKEGKKIAYISFEFNVNMAGGQPVSMNNLKEVYAYCKKRNIPVFFDATRCAENACFIQTKDSSYQNAPVEDILLEMFSYGDGATISAKKDMLSNLSGCLLFRDNENWYKKALHLLQLFEGTYCSGGTSAGDMAAHAQGIREMVNDDYILSRIDQTFYLGKLLHEAGIPIVLPPGGHAIFLDARRFLPHIDQDQYPAQMLAAQIYIETGVRSMERGNVSKGRNPLTGKNYRPNLELVRLTIPRRVYTRNHLKAVADGIIKLYQKRDTIKGLKFTYEPTKLRFFQGRFKEAD
ncbi:MAG: tryptophanase [Candidatus Aminicenantes bacterium]